jgi:hypothetical protein
MTIKLKHVLLPAIPWASPRGRPAGRQCTATVPSSPEHHSPCPSAQPLAIAAQVR